MAINQIGACVTAWIDRRIAVFGAVVVADRLIERSGLDQVGGMFGAWLLGLNDQLKNDLGDTDGYTEIACE